MDEGPQVLPQADSQQPVSQKPQPEQTQTQRPAPSYPQQDYFQTQGSLERTFGSTRFVRSSHEAFYPGPRPKCNQYLKSTRCDNCGALLQNRICYRCTGRRRPQSNAYQSKRHPQPRQGTRGEVQLQRSRPGPRYQAQQRGRNQTQQGFRVQAQAPSWGKFVYRREEERRVSYKYNYCNYYNAVIRPNR